MTIQFIDSHAHITYPEQYDQIDAILSRAREAGVVKIINICTDLDTLVKGIELKKRYPFIYNVASTTPHDVETEGEMVFPIMEKHAKAGDLVAVGETGLDYHYEHSPKETQKLFLRRYLHLALECKLPVVIHCREAFADLFEIIDEEYANAPGVLHCFTGSVAEAEEVIKRGWYLSLSGIVTFKKSEQLREVAKMVPLDRLLIETDAPFLAPQGHRGKVNEPSYIVETAQCIADVKNISLDELAHCTTRNASQVFKIRDNI